MLLVWVQNYRDQTKKSFYNAITFLIVLSVSIKDTYLYTVKAAVSVCQTDLVSDQEDKNIS